MDTSTVIALVALGFAALVTVFCLIKFFSGSGSSPRSSSDSGRKRSSSRPPRSSGGVTYGKKVEGFIQRGDGDSYVNLFALFNAAAVEEAEAKKAEEQQQRARKVAARDSRARWLSSFWHSCLGSWRSLKTHAARAIMPGPQLPEQSQSDVVSFKPRKRG